MEITSLKVLLNTSYSYIHIEAINQQTLSTPFNMYIVIFMILYEVEIKNESVSAQVNK